jgi:hypothetical protein
VSIIEKAIFLAVMTSVFGLGQAKAEGRDDLVNQIEEAIGKPLPIDEHSPLVTQTLTAARTANPEVDSRTWDEVRADTAAVLTRLSSGPGSAFDKRIRAALETFSDSELKSLNSKLNDPLLLRFRQGIQRQPNDKLGGAMPGMLQMMVEINGILNQHKLKPISLQ